MTNVPTRPIRTVTLTDISQLPGVITDVEQSAARCDYSRSFGEALRDIATDHKWGFSQGRSPSGEPWAPNKPSTIAKKGHGIVLVENGDLDASLSAVGGYGNIAQVESRGFIFGTRDPKSQLLQTGTSKMPARPHVGLADQRVDLLAELVADTCVEAMKV